MALESDDDCCNENFSLVVSSSESICCLSWANFEHIFWGLMK